MLDFLVVKTNTFASYALAYHCRIAFKKIAIFIGLAPPVFIDGRGLW